jgi:hypothetical protein
MVGFDGIPPPKVIHCDRKLYIATAYICGYASAGPPLQKWSRAELIGFRCIWARRSRYQTAIGVDLSGGASA